MCTVYTVCTMCTVYTVCTLGTICTINTVYTICTVHYVCCMYFLLFHILFFSITNVLYIKLFSSIVCLLYTFCLHTIVLFVHSMLSENSLTLSGHHYVFCDRVGVRVSYCSWLPVRSLSSVMTS